jgi:ATP-dependent Lon protease
MVRGAADILPVLPLCAGVLYPGVGAPFVVGRDGSLAAVEAALAREDKDLVVCRQRASEGEPRTLAELHAVGVRGHIRSLQRSPDSVTVLVHGIERVTLDSIVTAERAIFASVRPMPMLVDEGTDVEALAREALELVQQLIQLARGAEVPSLDSLLRPDEDRVRFVFAVASLLDLDSRKGQELLEQPKVSDALRLLVRHVAHELRILEVRTDIVRDVAGQMDKEQRDYVLRKQLKTIQEELGDGDSELVEAKELRERLAAAALPEHAAKEVARELGRLERIPAAAHEHQLVRSYVEFVLELPWNTESATKVELQAARAVLDVDHYGLTEVKERVIEHLAVLALNPTAKAPILCFLGAPGVGKTSLGQSIARALGRKFERMSLGGVHDEAELRGHRRTYIGALPGRILQSVRRAGTRNPLLMLDEVDKLGRDFRGDPAAALLEILDPEQNSQFRDNYLEIPFDLSHVMFITTANTADAIPPPLLDRMELVKLSGYTEEEKEQIAARYLVPRQRERAGLSPKNFEVDEDVVRYIVRRYTREAGVRQLERVIGKLVRKVAVRVAEGRVEPVCVKVDDLGAMLGPEPFFGDELRESLAVGVAAGLAWTEVGGALLYVESALLPGRSDLVLTGQLGEVMQESAKAALTTVWSRREELGIPAERIREAAPHVHVPAGAVPKDGPSAGVTVATALASLYTGHAVARDVGMTGEVTISGLVLPVGGIKEKVLAARRAGMKRILLPRANAMDLKEIDDRVLADVEVLFADVIEDVWSVAIPGLASRLQEGRHTNGGGLQRSTIAAGTPEGARQNRSRDA